MSLLPPCQRQARVVHEAARGYAYAPERLFARFKHQIDATYVNRLVPPARAKLTYNNLRMGAVLTWRLLTRVGLQSDYRQAFWNAWLYAVKRGQIEPAMGMGFVAHHLIRFSREALRGEQNASFYSTHDRVKEQIRYSA